MTRLVRLEGANVQSFPPEVIESLLAGGLAVFPTDTLYALGADPRSPAGLARLAAVKGRERGKPIPLLLSEPARARAYAADVGGPAERLMGRFWPGAVTVVLPSLPAVPDDVTGGGGTVGLRVPDHPVPRAIARSLGGAVTGTSANRAGTPGTWRDAEEIVVEFAGEVDWILWDGPSPVGTDGRAAASTVVRVEEGRVVLLREGAIPFREITEHLSRG